MDHTLTALATSTLASLLLILGVLLGATLLLRRLRAISWLQRTAPPSAITITATRPISAQTSLIIAQARGQSFLIGISRSGMTAIGRLDGHE